MPVARRALAAGREFLLIMGSRTAVAAQDDSLEEFFRSLIKLPLHFFISLLDFRISGFDPGRWRLC